MISYRYNIYTVEWQTAYTIRLHSRFICRGKAVVLRSTRPRALNTFQLWSIPSKWKVSCDIQ